MNRKFIVTIIVWVLILLFSMYLASQSFAHLSYNENVTLPSNSKAFIATNLLSKYFPSGSGNNSIDIVLVNSTPYEDYLIEQKLLNIPLITNVSGVPNVYISYANFLGKVVNETGSLLNESAYALYIFPEKFLFLLNETHNETLALSEAEKGMPSSYSSFYENFANTYVKTENYTLAFEVGISTLNKTQLIALAFINPQGFVTPEYVEKQLPIATAKVLNISPQVSSLLLFKSVNNALESDPKAFFRLLNPPSSLLAVYSKNHTDVILIYTKYSATAVYPNGTFIDEQIVPQVKESVKEVFNGTFYVTGETPVFAELSQLQNEYDAITFILIFAFLLVVTAIYFRSILAPIITLITISLSIISGLAMVTLVSLVTKQQIDFQVIEPMIAVIMGVGTDYSIFLLSRFREELSKGVDKWKAMEISVKTSGKAILISGTTVTIVFLSMTFIPFAGQWGLIIGLSVPFAVGIAVTLLPIIYGALGKKVFWPSKEFKVKPRFEKVAKLSTSKPVIVFVIALVIGLIAGFYVFSTPLNLNFQSYLPNTPAVQGLNVINRAFGENYLNPVLVVFNYSHPITLQDLIQVGKFEAEVSKLNGVEEVFGPVPLNFNGTITPSVLSMFKANVGNNNRTLLVTIIPSYKYDSIQAYNLVKEIQSLTETGYVGGTTADYLAFMDYLFPYYYTLMLLLPVVLAIIVAIFIRSIRIGIGVSLSIILTIVSALAIVYLGFRVSPNVGILFLIPIAVYVLMMGLGNDYSIFILSRVKEEIENGEKDPIVKGLSISANTITALGVILAFSFGALAINPIKSIQELGLAIALAAILDTFIVRTIIYPAILKISLVKRVEQSK
ncbi:MMPL family transporter [Sulfurisphaera ohwakuensis]|uniref:MMPL family transporter n=1 Tax=Sulfurisphaera ohwakuensis TaxID=69656 RepID=A0A650CHR7_SULOH|nr:MMPL family transporter [Sulfurisphaera ohwakuensis]MBB5253588.1 RND superfamily putative drug exporter [Sulfurisphaera ohwakuensis]QGR17394.1 MMPL family transporter [Sulfurisphaera ohwakuensis]